MGGGIRLGSTAITSLVSPELLAEEHILLVCDGLDTLATVSLNGHELGHTDNMFRRYEWEVKPFLNTQGDNDFTITFASPVKFMPPKQAVRPMPGPFRFIAWRPLPAQSSLPIWLGLGSAAPADRRLEGYPPGRLQEARLAEVHLQQQHANGQVTVKARVAVERWDVTPLTAVVRITTPTGEILEAEAALLSADDADGECANPQS